MITFTIYNSDAKPDERQKEEIVDFLHTHLGPYGDPKEHLLKCLHFAIKELPTAMGGFVLVSAFCR